MALSFTLFANEVVLNKNSKLFNDKNNIGEIKVLTPVEKLHVKNGYASIRIKGYRNANYPQQIVRSMKLGEIYADVKDDKKVLKLFKVIKKYEDDYGEEWEEVEGTFMVKETCLSDKKDALYEKAKFAYEKNCSQCHSLKKTTDYTVNQWPHQIETMKQYITLKPDVKALVIKYLQQNAKDVK